MMTLEELKAEAAKRGIVEGAVVKTLYDVVVRVGPPSIWTEGNDGCLYVKGGNHAVYHTAAISDTRSEQWAEVIEPAPSKEEGLKEGDAVECGPAMRAAIVELARELGVPYYLGIDIRGYPVLHWGRSAIIHGQRGTEGVNSVTPEAFIAKMRVTAAKPKPIKIGGHTVRFNTGSITVGCTTIDNATVRAVAEKLID